MVSDADLLRATPTDPSSFCELYDRYVGRIYEWLESRAGDPDVAMDLTAECFAKALLSVEQFEDRGGGSAAPWLFTIAGNLLRDWGRRQRAETSARRRLGMPIREDGHNDETQEIIDRLSDESLRADVRREVANLPNDQRQALELRVVAELPYLEVARRLGCSPGAARVRVSRAVQSIYARIQGAEQ